jgi:mannan polymerase II complex MNN11 subunit
MAAHPKAAYFFHLSPHALIMNPTTSLKSHLLDRSRLESLMLKRFPVVPPDSIIKTFTLKEKEVELIITQDGEDLSPSSFVLKNGDFARFFLDLWFDPLFRSYNFGKAEIHGLVRFFILHCWWTRD